MFNFLKKKKNKSSKDLIDDDGNIIEKSSLVNAKNGRFLKLNDETCAIILHPGNNVEIVFTKLYDPKNQTFTENEESLMALALFIKQPGFLELIKREFRRIANERITSLTETNEEK